MKNGFKITATALLLCSLSAWGGYRTGSAKAVKNASGELREGTTPSRRAPHLLPKKSNRKAVPKEPKKERRLNSHGLKTLLARYSRMSPEEWTKEINLLKQEITPDAPTGLDQKTLLLAMLLACTAGVEFPEQALLQLDSLGPLTAVMAPLIMQSWAETDPQAAAAYFLEHTEKLPHGHTMLKSISCAMAAREPDKAISWFLHLSKEQRKISSEPLFVTLARTRPDLLDAGLSRLEPSENAIRLYNQSYKEWNTHSPESAEKWLHSLPKNRQDWIKSALWIGESRVDPPFFYQDYRKEPPSWASWKDDPLIYYYTDKNNHAPSEEEIKEFEKFTDFN